MTATRHTLSTTFAALAAAATLGLAGCGTSSSTQPGPGGMDHGSSPATSSVPSASTSHDDADVMFVTMMLPHHEQAVAMSDTLLDKTGLDPRVTALAKQIKAEQQPEIETMKGWLDAWGRPATGGGMGSMSGGGMASDADLARLAQADGKAGQRLYLQLMTAHHEGAIRMAQTEISDGQDPAAVQLARGITTSQQKEIDTMKRLLATL